MERPATWALLLAALSAPVDLVDRGGSPVTAPRPFVDTVAPDLAEVLRGGVLRVALPVDRTSYVVVRGRVLGFDFEAVEAYADWLGVRLEVVVIPSLAERYQALRSGRVHLAGGRLAVDAREAADVRWSRPLTRMRLAIVGRQVVGADQRVIVPAQAGWSGAALEGASLGGRGSVGDAQHVEDVLAHVLGDVEAAGIVPERLARLEATRSRLVVHPLPQVVGARVAFRDDSVGLAGAFDDWLHAHPRLLARLERRYFEDATGWRRRAFDPAAMPDGEHLSPFDAPLREHAARTGWDWRLLAAVAYQESRWRPGARSHAGAVGLMQLMPRTARQVGVWNRRDPVQSISGGASYLAWLDGIWLSAVPDTRARLPLVLASYNVGAGHVQDARRLASAAGEDPDRWDVIAPWLLRLSDPVWASHPLVRHGRCRGSEPVHYVRAVLDRWRHYRALVPDASEA